MRSIEAEFGRRAAVGRGGWDALWAGIVVAALLGCGAADPPANVAAEIEGEPIGYAEYESFLERNAPDEAGLSDSAVLSALFDQFLDERLLVRLAVEDHEVAPSSDDRAIIGEIVDRETVLPDERSIAIHYRQNIARFALPARVELRQMLFTDRQTAQRVRDLWAGGMPYASLVEDFEGNASMQVGQEGEFLLDEMPTVFADVVSQLGEGDVSAVLEAEYGYHVFQVVRHLPAGTLALADAEASIAAELAMRRGEEALARLVAEARERYNVRVFERNLPFNYRGVYPLHSTDEKFR